MKKDKHYALNGISSIILGFVARGVFDDGECTMIDGGLGTTLLKRGEEDLPAGNYTVLGIETAREYDLRETIEELEEVDDCRGAFILRSGDSKYNFYVCGYNSDDPESVMALNSTDLDGLRDCVEAFEKRLEEYDDSGDGRQQEMILEVLPALYNLVDMDSVDDLEDEDAIDLLGRLERAVDVFYNS